MSARPGLDEASLRRFARQVVLPEVGEGGQARLLAARVRLRGRGAAFVVAAVYLAASGIGDLRLDDEDPVGDEAGRFPFEDARAGAWRGGALARRLAPGAAGRIGPDPQPTSPVDVVGLAGRPPAADDAGLPLRALVRTPDGTWRVVDRAPGVEEAGDPAGDPGPAAQAAGALLADAIVRAIVLGAGTPAALRLGADGAVG